MAHATASTEVNHEAPYELRSVSQTRPPHGSDGTWYRYVIAQGASVVVGVRSGTEAEVDYFLRDMIERLNERRMGKNRPRTKAAAPQHSLPKTVASAAESS